MGFALKGLIDALFSSKELNSKVILRDDNDELLIDERKITVIRNNFYLMP